MQISINSVIKIQEDIIHSFIFIHSDKYNILCNHQHGLCKNCFPESLLFTTSNDFLTCLNAGKHIDALYWILPEYLIKFHMENFVTDYLNSELMALY